MYTQKHDSFQLIADLHGADVSEEFDRVNAKLSNASTQAEIIRHYQVEIVFAERLISVWKKQFPKGQRPAQYEAKKQLVEVLNDEIAHWQGGADLTAATSADPATETVQKATAVPQRPIKQATLRGLALKDVQELFKHPFLQSEGERAAALAILNIQNYLPGSAYDLDTWFAANVGAKVSRRLISNIIREIREVGEVPEKAQQAAECVTHWLKAKAK